MYENQDEDVVPGSDHGSQHQQLRSPLFRRSFSYHHSYSSSGIYDEDREALQNGGQPRRTESQSSLTSTHSFSISQYLNDTDFVTWGWETTHQQRLILVALALQDFFCYMCLSLPAPFFPSEASAKGMSDTLIGWVFGVFALVQFLTSPIFGRLLTTVSSRFLCLGGTFLGGGCTVLFGMLGYLDNSQSLTFIIYCFVLRIFLSLGCTANTTASFAITAQTFPDNVGAVFGILETFTGLGMMVGPAVGGVLYEVGQFQLPFVVLGAAMVAFVPLLAWTLPKEDRQLIGGSTSHFRQLLRVPSIAIVNFSVIISAMVWAMLDPTLEPHLSAFDLSHTIIGLIFLLMSACYAISSPIWGWVADKMTNSTILLCIGFLISSVGLLFLGPSPILPYISNYNELWLNLLSLCVLGISVSLAMVPTFEKILDSVEKAGIDDSLSLYGSVAGLWGSANALGEFIGPSLGGSIMQAWKFPWTVSLVAALCLFMAVVLFIMWLVERRCERNKELPQEDSISVSVDTSESDTAPFFVTRPRHVQGHLEHLANSV